MMTVREFPVSESIKLQLRLDAINAFNHPVWGVPNSCQNCQNFGVVTSTVNNARQMQLSGKIVFKATLPEFDEPGPHSRAPVPLSTVLVRFCQFPLMYHPRDAA